MRYASYTDIIEQWGATALHHKLRYRTGTIQKWKERNHIPPRYWKEIIDLAKANDIPLSGDDLIAIAAKQKPAAKRSRR